MPYLIDGHNLIHFLDDIHLDDPHDEAKLVIKLRGFCARWRKKVVVVFDHGLPGGYSQLSTPSVMVIFASASNSDADSLIRERIKRTRDVKGWIVISSDNEILDEARNIGMRGMKCVDFAEKLTRPAEEKPHKGENPNVMVSDKEIQEWLEVFGVDADETFLDPTIVREAPSNPAPIIKRKRVKPTPSKPRHTKPKKTSYSGGQTDDTIDAWMNIFEQQPTPEVTDKPQAIHIERDEPEQVVDTGTDEINEEVKGGTLSVSENSVDAWLEVFGEVDTERQPTDPAYQRNDPSKQGRYRNEHGKREPTVHKRMATSDEVYLNDGEVDAWMDVFGASDDD